MPTLLECLNLTSYRHLHAIARAYYLPHPQRHPPKEVWVATLHHFLTQPESLHQLATRLGPDDWTALATLRDSPQPVVQHAFFARFGPIRAYRPWDPAAPLPEQPWHYPANPSERLWYLGLLFPAPSTRPGGPPRLCLPTEFYQAPLPLDDRTMTSPAPTSTPDHLPTAALATMFDLAVLLGLLHYYDIPPIHGRWLPVRFLSRWSQHTAQPFDLPPIRAERQAPRLHFIHYLAHAAGFLTGGRFVKPAPPATLWLQAQPAVRLTTLWQAWPQPDLWQTYRLPASETPDALAFVQHLLDRLHQAHTPHWLTIPALLHDLAQPLHAEPVWWQEPAMAPTLPEALARLVHGPLRWLGLVETNADLPLLSPDASHESETPPPAELAARLTPAARQHRAGQPLPTSTQRRPIPGTVADQQVTFTIDTDPTSLTTLDLQHLFEILCLCGDQQLTPAGLNLTLERGHTFEAVVRLLAEVRQQPLDAAEYATLRSWATTPPPLTLRQLTILEADTPERLNQVVSRPTIRPFLRRTLSRRAVAVDFRQVPQLVTRLQRIGVPLHVLVPGLALDANGSPRPTGESTATHLTGSAYLLLAGLVYRQLSRFTGLPVMIPTAVLDEIMTQLPPATAADVQALAEEVLNRVQHAFDGYSDPPLDNPFPHATGVLPALHRAIADNTSITFSYWTAGRGELTHRTVDPYRIETRHGVAYLVAYCHTRRAERVFRIDRIVDVTAKLGDGPESVNPIS